jgi:AcrR family transcriptional regulator
MTPPKGSGDALTNAHIIDAAQLIITEVGVDGLTMRGLSDRLGVALGATYHHVGTKHDLLVLVGSSLYDTVAFPPETDDWAGWIRTVMIDLARVVSRYPGIATYLIDHLAEIPPLELNIRVGTVLAEAGFSDRSILAVMGALTFFVAGACATGIPDRPSSAFVDIDATRMFEDGLDLILGGAHHVLDRDGLAAVEGV